MTSISVIGGGVWGTALAMVAQRANLNVTLWGWDHPETTALIEKRECVRLPGLVVDQKIKITKDLKLAGKSNIILLAVPAQTTRDVAKELATHLQDETYVVICSKGIELETGLLMSEVASEHLSEHSISVLSGPTFATEVAQNLPTAATVANDEITTSRWLASSLSSDTFRLYPSSDIIGIQLCGALKNVIAIAAGIVAARNLGDSACASLITRGLMEISRLGLAMGAKSESFQSLAGTGDLFMSCTSPQSRNMSLGYKIGESNRPQVDQNLLTEGAYTVKSASELAAQYDVDMPICAAVHRILYENALIDTEIEGLLGRSIKNETGRKRCTTGS